VIITYEKFSKKIIDNGGKVWDNKIMENEQLTLYGFETREPDKRRSSPAYDIKRLWQRSHEIIGLALQGMKQTEIAKILNISPVTVSTTLNSELGREKLSKLREDRDQGFVKVTEEVARLSKKALEVYEEIFDNKTVPYSLKKSTSDTVLMELGGHRAPTKIDTRSIHMTATMEEIEEFKRRGVAAARESGMVVDLPEESSDKSSQASLTDESLLSEKSSGSGQALHGRRISNVDVDVDVDTNVNLNDDKEEDELKKAPE